MKKKKKSPKVQSPQEKKRLYIIVGILVTVAIVILLATTMIPPEPTITNGETLLCLSDDDCENNTVCDRYYKECKQPRCAGALCLPPSLFRRLPEMPTDFGPIQTSYQANRLGDPCYSINESYWKQPEWYTDTWETTGVREYYSKIQTLNEGGAVRSTKAVGLFYPGELMFSMKKGEILHTCVNMANMWTVNKWIGGKVALIIPKTHPGFLTNPFPDGSQTLDAPQNATEVLKYFDVEIVTPYERNHMLLDPSWGFFYGNWTQKLDIYVTVHPDTPAGKYILGFNLAASDKDFYSTWYEGPVDYWNLGCDFPEDDRCPSYRRLTAYIDAGELGFGLIRPALSIGIQVI